MSVFELASATIPISVDGMSKVLSDLNTIKGELVSKLGGSLMKGLGMLGVAVGVGTIISKSISSAMDAEAHLKELKETLAAMGQAVDTNVAKFKELATNIQATTTTSKGQVMALLQHGLQLGLTADQSERLSTTALGLSKRLGIDSKEALELLARGDERAMTALGRHSKEIANATTLQGKLDAINKVAKEGMAMAHGELDTGKGKWEHLEQTISSLYTKMGEGLMPVISKIIDGLSDFFDWITQLIGAVQDFGSSCSIFSTSGDAVSGFGTVFSSVCKTIKEYVEGIVFAFNNWDLVVKEVGIEMAMTVVGMGERLAWFGQQVPIVLTWIWDNWKEIFTTIGSFVKSVFMGVVENVKNLWGALLGWFKGAGFNFNWTPLMKDFQSTIKEAPAFTKFIHSDMYNGLSKQLDETDKEFQQRAEKWQGSMDKGKIDKKKAAKAVDATIGIVAGDVNKDKSKTSGSGFSGLADFWKKAQENLLKAGEKEAQQAQKKTADNTAKIEKHLAKIAGKPGLAMAG